MISTATKQDIKRLEEALGSDSSKADKQFAGIDKKFDNIDIQFNNVGKQFNNIDKRFDELTDMMRGFMQQVSDEFEKVHIKLDKHDADITRILNHLDAIEKQIEIDETERQVISLQLTRIHDWVIQAGKQIGLEFKV